MLLVETAIFYLLLGAAVATAVYLRGASGGGIRTGFNVVAACLFWPLYVPVLLAPVKSEKHATVQAASPPADVQDSLAAAIAQVEAELDAALDGLDGWAEDVLNSEAHRLTELRSAWKLQAQRIRELDRLLAAPESRDDSLAEAAVDIEKARQSEKLRRENIRQLGSLRKQMHADLIGTLAWVRELVTMIHLAKFSGAPAARAEELVAQIAAAVQGLSEVSAWREQEEFAAVH
jgi:hypothetical protein